MSALLRDQDLTRSARASRPAHGWRNRMWFERVVQFKDGGVRGPGVWLAQLTYPSAEIAETRAMEWLRVHAAHGHPFGAVSWIEAVPVGDAE